MGKAIKRANKTDTIKAEFLLALLDEKCCGNVEVACKMIGRNRTYLYELRDKDEAFAAAWDKNVKEGRRIGAGVAEWGLMNNIHKGNVTAQIFYLKANMSEVYGDKVQHTGKDGGPIQHDVETYVYKNLSDWMKARAKQMTEDNGQESTD